MGDAKFDGNVPATAGVRGPGTRRRARGSSREFECAGLYEHVHPHISGSKGELLSDRYYGIAITDDHDVFFGGQIRSTRFYYGHDSDDYWTAQSETEDNGYAWNRFDIWADRCRTTPPRPSAWTTTSPP